MSVHVRRLLPRLYLTAEPWLLRCLRVSKGLFDGVWLGLLSSQQLDEIDERYYDAQNQYVDGAYNRRGLWPWEQAVIDRYFASCNRIVVTGAGGGREMLALLRSGYDAIAFECNDHLVAVGRRLLLDEGYSAELRTVARHTWPSHPGRFDGVIVGWGSYMLTPGRHRRVRFLRGARAGLSGGAPILLSFFSRKDTSTYLQTVSLVANVLRRFQRRPRVDMGDALAPNFVHYFTRDEIFSELRDGGFDPVFYDDSYYGVAVGLAS